METESPMNTNKFNFCSIYKGASRRNNAFTILNFAQLIFLTLLFGLSSVDAQKNRLPADFTQNARIVFQGDSITDGGRGRTGDPNSILGQSYVFLIAAPLAADSPEKNLTFYNRGVSGNTLGDLIARWQTDVIDLKPDYLSILVGINDVANIVQNPQNGETAADFETRYDALLKKTIQQFPNIKLVLCEPFIFPSSAILGSFPVYQAETKKLQVTVEKLGLKYQVPVVHFQKVFDQASLRAPIGYWIWDGVHPTYAGHQLMADEWVRVVNEYYSSKQLEVKK